VDNGVLNEEALCKLMVDTHGARFDGRIWDAFDEAVVPYLEEYPVIADLGSGPGLFLFDLCQRLPEAQLVGFDTSQTMLEFAANLSWTGASPQLKQADVRDGIPDSDGRFDLVAMNFFLHQFDHPQGVLSEAGRTLKPGGLLWMYDWARRPLQDYLNFWSVDPGLPGADIDPVLPYRLFPLHNRFTREDWLYVLSEAGFVPRHEVKRANGQHLLLVLSKADWTRGAS
jgi:SAM-dependent methyltransferase